MYDYKFLGSIHIGQFCAVVQVPLEKSYTVKTKW